MPAVGVRATQDKRPSTTWQGHVGITLRNVLTPDTNAGFAIQGRQEERLAYVTCCVHGKREKHVELGGGS